MPTIKKRKYAHQSKDKLTEEQSEWLLMGAWGLDPDDMSQVAEIVEEMGDGTLHRETIPFPDVATAEKAWKKHRREIMGLSKPGERPYAWWRFEAPEPRRQLSGPKPIESEYFYFGQPNYWNDFDDEKAAVFETQVEYLTRLGLIDDDELEQLEDLDDL